MLRIALGTVQFGLPYGVANNTGQVPLPEAKKMLKVAGDNGMRVLDTAMSYGDSEARLGEAGVGNFSVVTKLPSVPDDCTDLHGWTRDQVLASLGKLCVSRMYGLLLHSSRQLLGQQGPEIYKALCELQDEGLVEKIGVSIYSPFELDEMGGKYKLDLIQAPFNVVDRRLHSSGWLARLKGDGVEIHARSAFLQGLLLMPLESIPTKFLRWSHLWEAWERWLTLHELSPVQACLQFSLAFPEIDQVVVGADSSRQLLEILEATKSTVTFKFPDIQSENENLVNPSRWGAL